jgi:hypothetical protein
MEVHHAHHPSHKKALKEYFLEFFMLFFAVTLGFFAENIREHYVEKGREIKFLQNIHQDLQKDIKEIDTTVAFIDKKQLLSDSLFIEVKSDKIYTDLPSFYYYIKNLSFRHLFENSDNGFTQLKTSGGLRLIENNEIIDKIQDYTNVLNRTLSLQELNESTGLNYNAKVAKLLDVVTSVEMNEAQYVPVTSTTKDYSRFLKPEHPRPLTSAKKDDVNELLNIVFTIVNRNKYLKQRLLGVKKAAIQLDGLIVKEYGSHFK